MKSGLPALLLALWLPAAAGAAAPEPTHLLATLAGDWDLSGTVLGKSAHYRARGRWVLNGGWLEFSMIDVATPPGYEARVFIGYDAKAGDYVAHWLDRFGAAGARVTATGTGEDGTLVLLFPYAEGAFRDTLSLAPDGASGSLLLEMHKADGSWSTFASYQMKRRAPARAKDSAR
jgi:hypothetical protein